MTREWSEKGGLGNFFEDFALGESVQLPLPRTLTAGDVAVYTALTGDRTPMYTGPTGAVHPWLVFHTVFGQTVRYVSLNAVANLGYAGLVWTGAVHVGDTLSARVKIIGLKENSSRASGIVYVQTVGINQHGAEVIRFARWVMVKKRDAQATPYLKSPVVPTLTEAVSASDLDVPAALVPCRAQTGSALRLSDYRIGERIAHHDGATLTEGEHMSFTRLFQNSARIHFDAMRTGGRPLIYGGVIISLGYALSHHGLEGRVGVRAVNGGAHANPSHAGDTLYAFTEVLDTAELGEGVGAIRLRLVVTKNLRPWEDEGFTVMVDDPRGLGRRRRHPSVVLDLDYWDALPA